MTEAEILCVLELIESGAVFWDTRSTSIVFFINTTGNRAYGNDAPPVMRKISERFYERCNWETERSGQVRLTAEGERILKELRGQNE